MARKDFIGTLQHPTPIPFDNSLNNFIKCLQENYPECSISLEQIERKTSDGKDDFITIQLKSNDNPIKFRIPTKKVDLSIYQSSPDYDRLNYRYDLYTSIYKDKIMKQFVKERMYLQERFPHVIFNTKIRQKSRFSYEDKIIERMIQNKSLDESSQKSYFIRDVIAGRHIISYVDGDTDPKVLNKLCFEFEQAIREFRESEKNEGFNIVLQKDYITSPKPNGYQSIHLINEDSTNPDCSYETQIRTLDMEENSHKGTAAHNTYKKTIIDEYALSRLPMYSNITSYTDDSGEPIILSPSPEEAFYHFYGIQLSEYTTQLNSIMPIINDIKTNLYFKEPIKPKEIG